MQWFFPFMLSAILSNRSIYLPEWTLNRIHVDFSKIMYFSGFSTSKLFLHITLFFHSSTRMIVKMIERLLTQLSTNVVYIQILSFW